MMFMMQASIVYPFVCLFRYYHQFDKFHNLLRMISNEVVHRAHAMVGEDVLREPLEVCIFSTDGSIQQRVCCVYVAMPWLHTTRCLWPLLVVLEAEGSAASVRRLPRHLPRLSRQGRGHQREKQTGARQQNVSLCTLVRQL